MTDKHDLCRDGIVSNCCGAEILMADKDGFGICADCKEHCGSEVEEEKENENDRPQR